MGRKPVNWNAENEALLGRVPDRVIAERMGVNRATVSTHRQKLGIPAANNSSRSSHVDFGEWLRAAIMDLGLTQKEAAEIFDVSLTLLEQWIAGPAKSWGRVPNKLEKAGISAILRQHRQRSR